MAKLGDRLQSSKVYISRRFGVVSPRKCSGVSDGSDSFVDLGIEISRKDDIVI